MAVPATSNHVSRPSSPAPTVSLVEIMEDTRLVLGAFLRQSLAVPLAQRPGRIGGAYKDHSKYSAFEKNFPRKAEDGWDSLDERISAAEEKKHGIKDLIRKRLRQRSTVLRRSQKDSSKKDVQVQSGSLERDIRTGLAKLDVSGKTKSIDRTQHLQDKPESERQSPTSSSDEGSGKKESKKKKKKSPLSSLLRKIKPPKNEETANAESQPKRPNSLKFAAGVEPEATPASPSHPPQFYNELAETLDKIAQKHTAKLSPVSPPPSTSESEIVDLK